MMVPPGFMRQQVADDLMRASPLEVTLTNPSGGGSSGGLTDDELRAAPVPISGTVTANVGTVAVTGPLTDAQLRNSAISVTFTNATLAVTGPLTDAQLRAAPLPVSGTITANAGSGTFAVSAASLPLPGGAATETTLAAISTKTLAAGQATMANSSPVVLASNQSAIPVTIAAAMAVTDNNGSLTVDNGGTFAVQASQTGTWNVGTITSITNAVTITPPTLTKGTQGSTGLSTQDLKDAGRAIVNAATNIAGVTAVTTEALLALNVSRDGANVASVTTIAVTSGKRLRIVGVTAGIISIAAAVISARVCLRMNPSGSAAANSPILAILTMSQQAAALAQAGDSCVMMFPEAIEISGTMQIGLSQVASVTTGTVWASLIAYEY